MTFQDVNRMVESIGFPYAYRAFPEGTEQTTPFVCFFFTNNNDFIADDSNYQKIEHLAIELYTDTKDFSAEQEVEAALSANNMVYTRSETEIPDERMYEVVYETDVVINLTEE